MFLDLARVKGVALRVDAGGDHIEPLVHVRKQERGADAGLRVETRASVAVSARADLEVKRTVYSVFLGAENRRQVLRHRRFRNTISEVTNTTAFLVRKAVRRRGVVGLASMGD